MKNTNEIVNATVNETISPEILEKVRASKSDEEKVKILLPYLEMPDYFEIDVMFWEWFADEILMGVGISQSKEEIEAIFEKEENNLESIFELITFKNNIGDNITIENIIPSKYEVICELINQDNPILRESGVELDMNDFFNPDCWEMDEYLENDPRNLAREYSYFDTDPEEIKSIILDFGFMTKEEKEKYYEEKKKYHLA